jgi:hypothetical protein
LVELNLQSSLINFNIFTLKLISGRIALRKLIIEDENEMLNDEKVG